MDRSNSRISHSIGGAFTLIEILIATAIVAFLAALLFSVFAPFAFPLAPTPHP